MKKNYKLHVYERAVIDAAVYWYRIGKGPFATNVLTRCINMLENKVKRLYYGKRRARQKRKTRDRKV